ncbi:MAG: ABC transporter [Lentisphaerae bacterium RIFOXYB12_FULL_65_16]|nr:MAG: ABC transporter [Lentisphaerae bacterium RIFOXYA12_64_32]OGV93522.1 MAG: ABC transporter [Lentisphaerae bacterium RIFOXYB12_FULL_65_16]
MALETRPVIVSGTGLCVQFSQQVVLQDAEFAVHEGERVGVVGRNGAGKSTLLKLLAGIEKADTGTLAWKRNLTVAFLPQDVAVDDTRTVRENILDGALSVLEWIRRYETLPHDAAEAVELEHRITAHNGWDLERRTSELATRLDAPALDRRVESLSGGEKRRVGLCRTLIGQPDLLVLDEPTNHLDTVSITWLEETLAVYPGTCIMVTHDRYFLDRVTDRIVEIAGGLMYSHPGHYTDYLEAKAARDDDAERREENRQSFLRREIDWIRRGPKARTTKSRSRVERFEEAAAQKAPERDRDVELVIPPAPKLGNRVVDLNGVSMEIGGRRLFSGLDLHIEPGARIGIVGRNGVGKTTLLNVILGRLAPTAGTVQFGELTQFNYVDQHRLFLNGENSLLKEVAEGKDFVQLGADRITVWGYLRRFLFADDRINMAVKWLSGGERSRALLAKILKNGGNVLILDEPTNDLDLATLRMLEEALIAFSGCVLLVSHDRCFLNRVCTAILAFENDGRVVYQDGDYDYYIEKFTERQRAAALATATAATAEPKTAPPPKPKVRRLTWRETKELEGMEPTILDTETRIAELEGAFSAPDFYTRHGAKAQEMAAELETARARVAQLYARWEELEAIRASQA